jgi:hypothetical protein
MDIKSSTFLSIVGGGVIAGIALFVSNILYRWWVRPKLSIEAGEISETEDWFIRVVVKNEGKTAAQNCVGKISIDNVSADDLLKLSGIVTDIDQVNFRPTKGMNLPWTNTNSEYNTINAHDNEVLNVFQKVSSENVLAIGVCMEKGVFNKRCVLNYSEGKEYIGKISTTTENAKGTEINFIMKVVDGKINLKL